MSTKLQDVIEAARKLSPREQLDLISAVSASLQHAYAQAEGDASFWEPKSLEQHIQAQGTPVIQDITQLKATFWPEDESADDVLKDIYRQRREDRSN
jgi:hypothetical protein